MSSVDNRIVEMEFDNANFESGVTQTIDSINRLRDSLGLKNIDLNLDQISSAINKLDFDNINSAVDTVVNKFSVFGTIADQVLRNIGNTIFGVGRSLLSNLITPLTTGGWNRAMNIEKARFSIEGLGLSFEELSQDIMTSVNDTAYTFDAAANAASSLAASGIKPGHQMLVFLRAITGIAAQTNSEYSDMANIFTTIAGNGQVMTMQLRQLSLRGMNAAATLAKFFNEVNEKAARGEYVQNRDFVNWLQSEVGTAQLTEADIYELVRKGKISASLFAAAMDETFGSHASKANDTFAGSLANIRAALSKIGQMFSAPIIQQMPDIFNAVRKSINDIKAAMTPFIDDASAYNKAIKDVIRNIAAWIDARNFSWVEHLIRGTDTLIRLLIKLGDALFFIGSNKVLTNLLPRLFGELPGQFDWIFGAFELYAGRFEELMTQLSYVSRKFYESLSNIGNAVFAVFSVVWYVFDSIVKAGFEALFPVLRTVTDILVDLSGLVGRTVFNSFDSFVLALRHLSTLLQRVGIFLGKTASGGLRGIFNKIRPSLDNLFLAIDKLVAAFGRLSDIVILRVGRAFGIVKELLPPIEDVLIDGIAFALSFIIDRMTDAVNLLSDLGGYLAEHTEWLDAILFVLGAVGGAFGYFLDRVSEAIELFQQLQESTTDIDLDFSIQGLGRSGYNLLTAFAQSFGISQEYVDIFADHVNKAMEVVGGFAASVRDWFLSIDFAGMWASIKDFGKNVADTFINELVPAFQSGLPNGLEKLREILRDFAQKVSGLVTTAFDTYVRPAFESLFGGVIEKIRGFWEKVLDAVNRIFVEKDTTKGIAGAKPRSLFKGIRYIIDEILNFDFEAAIDILLDYLGDIKVLAVDLAQGIGEITYKVGSIIRNVLYNVGWTDLVNFINGLLVLWTKWNLSRLISNIAGVVGAAKDVLKQVAGFIKSASKVFKGISRVLNATALLEVAASILLMVIAFEKLGRLMEELKGSSSLSAAWLTLMLLFVVMLAAFWFINKTSEEAVTPATGSLYNVNVLAALITDIKKGLGKIAEGFRMAGVASAIVAIAAAVFVLVGAMVLLSMLPVESVVVGAGVVILTLVALGFLTKAIKDSGNALGMAAFGIFAIALAVGIIVSSVVKIFNLLSDMSKGNRIDQFNRSLGFVTGLLVGLVAVFAGIVIAANFIKPTKEAVAAIAAAGIAILLVTASLFLISGALHALKTVSPETMRAEVDAFTRIIVIIGTMIFAIATLPKLLGDAGWGEILAAGAAIALAMVALNIVSMALAGLSFIDPGRLGSVIGSLSLILIISSLMMALLMAVSGGDWAAMVGAAASLVVMSVAVVILADALRKLEELKDMDSVLVVARDILSYLTIFAIGLGVVGALLGPAMLIGSAAVVILVLALNWLGDALANIAEALNSYQDIGTSAENIGSVLSEITHAFENWGSVGLGIAGITGGISDAAQALVDLSPVIDAFRDVGAAPENIGKVVQGIVDGLGSTAADNVFAGAQALVNAADGLIALSPVLQSYSGDFGMIPSNIRAVCESILNGVAGLGGQKDAGATFKDVAEGLKTLAAVLQRYARDNIEEIAENFKTVCEKIGEGMKSFGTPDQYAESFSKVAKALKTMAPALDAYKDISEEDATHMATLIHTLAGAFVEVEGIDDKGVIAMSDSFASIGETIQNFPTDASAYTNALSEITTSTETFTGDMSSILENFNMQDILDQSGMSYEDFFGSLTSGAGIAGAEGGGAYGQEFMANAASMFSGGGGGFFSTGETMWSGAEDQARAAGAATGSAFVEGMETSGATDKISEMVAAAGQALADGVNDINAAQYSRQIVTDYMDGFSGNALSIQSATYTLGVSVTAGFKKAESSFKQAGSDAANAYLNGLTGKNSSLEAKGRSMANSVASGIRQGASASAANQVGRDFVQGFINGVNMQAFRAFAAGMHIGNQAMKGLKFSLNSKSPSRKAMEVGGYFTEGFIIGINKDVAGAEKSAFSLGTAADHALNSAISGALSWFDDNNGEVTITPVLDLSQIQSGARTMQSMLGSSAPNLNAGYSAPMLVGADTVAARGNAQSVVYQFDFGNAVLNNDADMQNAALNLLETLKRKADMYG